MEIRRVLATAVDDAYSTPSDTMLMVPNGEMDLLSNDTDAFYEIQSITSSTNASDLWPVARLIDGAGTGYQADLPHNQLGPANSSSRWVTDAPGGGSADYFVVAPPPVLIIDLGSDKPLEEISTWGYNSGNGNGVKEFSLAFATDAEGTGGFGNSVTYNPTFTMILNDVPRQSFPFSQQVTARYVQLTATDNFFEDLAGGDRVGLGEVAFRIPDAVSNLAAGKPYAYSRLPTFSGGTFYLDNPHVQTVDVYSTGDLTDGTIFTGSSPTTPNPSTIVGWGDPPNLDADITFDLGAESLISDVIIGTHTWSPFANGAPDDVDISFSNDGVNFSGTETFTYTAADVPSNGHRDLPADVSDTVAQYVRLSFDGGAVLTGNTPNKWMLDEIVINGSESPVRVTTADVVSAQGATVTVNSDGSFSYDPTSTAAFDSLPENATAIDTFTYTMTDGTGTDTATVTVSVVGAGNGIDDPPIANDDTVNTTEDMIAGPLPAYEETFSVDAASAAAITANYPNIDAGLTDSSVSGGVLTINTGTDTVAVTATAAPGEDRTFSVDIGAQTASPGGYNIGITWGQNNIVFHPGYTPIPGAFRVEGPGGFGNSNLGFVPAIGTMHRFVVRENSSTGEFTVSVIDGDNPSNVYTRTFTNPGSVGGQISLRRSGPNVGNAMFDNILLEPGSLLTNDVDLEGAMLSAGPATVTTAQGIGVTINPNGTFVYDPGATFQSLAEGDTAVDTFSYFASDGNSTDTATLTVNIAGLNDDPVAGDDSGFGTDEDTILSGSDLLLNDMDVDAGDSIEVVAGTVISTLGATVTLNTDGTFSYDPGFAFASLAAGDTASDTFVYTIEDSLGATDTATVAVTVTGVDDPAAAGDDAGRTDEDTPLTSVISYTETFDMEAATAGEINAFYPELDAIGFDASVVGGQLSLNSGTINLPIALGSSNMRTIVLEVGANTGAPGSYNAGFNIGQNRIVFHPGFTPTPGAFRVEGPGGFGNRDMGFVPPVGTLHTFEIVENAATGEFTITVTDGTNPSNVFTASFTNPASVGAEVSFRREGGNNGPGLYDNIQIVSDSLLGNDYDPDSAVTLTAGPASATSTAGAAVTINPDGTFVYDPGTVFQYLGEGETATDTFTYTISDGTVTDTATVTVTIDGLNDVPTDVMSGGPYTIAEGDQLDLMGSFTDPDASDTHTIEWDVNGDGTVDATGLTPSFTWAELEALVPPINDGSATFTVTFSVDDGTGPVTDTTTLTVDNTAPSVSIAGPASALLATSVDFTLTPFDPSSPDTTAGFDYLIDWGDGTPVETATSSMGAPSVVSHAFETVGVTTVTVTIEDRDGGTTTETTTIEIVPVAIVDGDLVAIGTNTSERIIFFPTNGSVRVRYGDLFYPLDGSSFQPTGGLIADGRGGNDQIIVNGNMPYSATFDGGAGNDYLAGGTFGDYLSGGLGNDIILGGEGDNTLDGGDGSDRIEGRSGADLIFGGTGNDRLNGGAGNDILDGGADNDYLFGGLGDDLIAGRAGVDSINGYVGNDVIYGGDDADQIFGGVGNDLLFGGLGGDRLRGDDGDDVIVGGTSGLEADTETSLDDLLATGSLMTNVQAALDAWFASQDIASRTLYEPFTDDMEADELAGGAGVETFQSGVNDTLRDVRAGDTVLP